MQAERWQQIDEIFHSALKVEESRRTALLRETCSGDENLLLELGRLLALQSKAENFLEFAAVDIAAKVLSGSGRLLDPEPALVGQTTSHYRIVAKLGSGGMGFVYGAEDIRLVRRVALKFLPVSLARNPRALERFEREALAASSLNHANICTIYEVEEHDHQPVIVMELLEGQSLQQRICEGHAKGILHRDIKPPNIFLVGRQAKVLDFGLAKIMRAPVMESCIGDESLTLENAIAGTASYMSPEQARG
jgi:serine/threonine protein kinase